MDRRKNLNNMFVGCKLTDINSIWESRQSPFYEETKEETEKWFLGFDSLQSKEEQERFLAADFTLFVSYIHPTASKELFRILCDYYHWVFAWDDLFDLVNKHGNQYDRCVELKEEIAKIFTFDFVAKEKNLVAMLFDIWERLKKFMSPLQQYKFSFFIKEFTEGEVEQVNAGLGEKTDSRFKNR